MSLDAAARVAARSVAGALITLAAVGRAGTGQRHAARREHPVHRRLALDLRAAGVRLALQGHRRHAHVRARAGRLVHRAASRRAGSCAVARGSRPTPRVASVSRCRRAPRRSRRACASTSTTRTCASRTRSSGRGPRTWSSRWRSPTRSCATRCGPRSSSSTATRATASPSGWRISPDMDLKPDFGGSVPGARYVALRFTAVKKASTSAEFRIDDVCVDPRMRR